MSKHEKNELPVFAVSDDKGRAMHLVLSIGLFRAQNGIAEETLLPAVEDALNRAQRLSGSELLHCYYLHTPRSVEGLVDQVRVAVERTLSAQKGVLWMRADTEDFARAALEIVKADYPSVTVECEKPDKGAA
jgi:hypothetical protein